MAQAFERGKVQIEIAPDDAFGSETTGIWDGEQLRAAVTVRPFLVHWDNAISGVLSMGGIAGVATGIEARGRGYVDSLLRDSLVRMREAGQVISALYPFAWAFYRKFGWEWVGEKRSVSLPLREIKSTSEGRLVREVPSEQAKVLLSPIYDRYAAQYHGAFTSGFHQWEDKLRHSDDRTTFVYAYFPEGRTEPTAYLLWRYDSGGSDGGEVREFVANSPDGYRALFGLLHYLGTQCRTARLVAPADAPLWSHLYHWEISTKIEPVFQARVVDVCAAMAQIAPPTDYSEKEKVAVRICDDAAPWNNGAFLITIADGKVQCTPSNADNVDIKLDIQAFSQAFWGAPSLPMLRNAGGVEVLRESGYRALCRLLPETFVFTMDFF